MVIESEMALALQNGAAKIRIVPSDKWNSKAINNEESYLFNPKTIEKMYYIGMKEVENKNAANKTEW